MPRNKAAPKKERCYIYTRVSTQMQVEGYSLDAQRERLLREAKHREMVVAAEFSDEGKSGKNITDRPEFTRMLRLIQSGNPDGVNYVLVFKLSRFGRNAADVLSSLQLMQDNKVQLICVEDGIDSSKEAGKLMISVLSAVAEIERENIRAQTMAGRWQKAREGKWNGGQAPYGYRIENGDLVVQEPEAGLVRLIFDKFANTDMGYSGVASWLNANGHRKSVRRDDQSSRISSHFVKAILDNPVYVGKIAYGRVRSEKITGKHNEYHRVKQDEYELFDGRHEALISNELWEAVRLKRAMTGVKTEKRYGPKHCHILSGLVMCPECGAPMYGRVYSKPKNDGSGERYEGVWYYLCRNAASTSNTKCGYRHHIRQDVLDAQVRAVVQEALRNMDFTERVMAAVKSRSDLDVLNVELDTLEATRRKEVRQKTRLLSKIAELDADDELYDVMYGELQSVLRERLQSIAQLDEQIERVTREIHNAGRQAATADHVRMFIHTVIDMMDVMPGEDERKIMQTILHSIQIHPKPLPNGLVLKSLRFKFLLDDDGFVSDTIEIADTDDGDWDGDVPSSGGPPPDKDPQAGGGSPFNGNTGTDGSSPSVSDSLPDGTYVSSYFHGKLFGRWPVNAQAVLSIWATSQFSEELYFF